MHLRGPIGLAIVVGLLTPTVLAKPIPIFDGIFNTIKEKLNKLIDNGLSNLSKPIQEEAKELLDGAFAGSPGQPFPAELLPYLYYTAEYASASYCLESMHIVGKKTECRDNFCPDINKNNVTTEATFANKGSADTTGIVVLDATQKTIAVAYRGSQSIRNWFTNAQIDTKSMPEWCSGCEVHSGFYDAYLEEQNIVVDSVTRLTKENPDYKLVITGHSLGGAVATIASTDLRKRGFELTLVTYGSPRVGNDKLAEFLSNNGKNYRVTHLNDPVPRLPPLTLGYRHMTPEYHIFRGDYPVAAGDIKVYAGTVNFQGNTGAGGIASFNTSAHKQYFLQGKFSGCDSGQRDGIEFR